MDSSPHDISANVAVWFVTRHRKRRREKEESKQKNRRERKEKRNQLGEKVPNKRAIDIHTIHLASQRIIWTNRTSKRTRRTKTTNDRLLVYSDVRTRKNSSRKRRKRKAFLYDQRHV